MIAFTALALSPWLRIGGLVIAAALIIALEWFRAQRTIRNPEQTNSPSLEAWIDELTRHATKRELEERSHPALIADLEACAVLRARIRSELKNPTWTELRKRSSWNEVSLACARSAEHLFLEAVWAGKGTIRGIGARKATFAKNCADPQFGKASLEAVALARSQLERLLDEVADNPFTVQDAIDPLERARAELQAIKLAEEELGILEVDL